MEVDYPGDFRCPISKEVMKDPVTVSTGVTYERKNIEKWFFNYKKSTCPATMQCLHSFDLTPNHTLQRLIQNWQINNKTNPDSPSCSSSPQPSIKHDEMVSLLRDIESSPFKVTPLKKLRSVLGDWSSTTTIIDFIGSGGIDVLVKIIIEVLVDFDGFRACEEALRILHDSPLQLEEDKMFGQLSKPECIKAMIVILRRGSADARLYAITIFRKLEKTNMISNCLIKDQGIDFFKSLLELVSDDEICSKASACALEVLIEIQGSSKKIRLKAIEAGAICLLLELLPDSNRSKCEKILLLIKLLCENAEGRLAVVEHGLGIAAVTNKLLHVSNAATKLAVKILWLICNFNPTEKVVEEMMICGSVKKLLALMHMDGRSSTKERVIKMFKLHGNSWRRYPCFPAEWKEYLGLES